jgi:signal transduction histidine kinase
MAFWHNPLLRKTVVFMLAGLLGLAAIVATSLWLARKVESNADELNQERQVRLQAAALLALAADAETGQRGFLLTEDPKYLQPYDMSVAGVAEAVNNLQGLAVRTPRIQEAVERVSSLIKDKYAELAETVALSRAGRRIEALDVVRSDRGKKVMDEIRAILDEIVGDSDRHVSSLVEEGRSATSALFWVNALSSALIVILAIAAGAVVTRYTSELASAREAVAAANLTLEARVQERTTALSRANDEIQRFAYIVSHDLRAPLVNIVGFTSELEAGTQALQRFVTHAMVAAADDPLVAQARTAANDDLPEAIGFIRASTTKMDRLINAILKLSREGRRELRPEPIALRPMFDAIAASVQHQLDQAGARIEIAGDMPTVICDRLALEQVFGNLVDNAVKYLSADRAGLIQIAAAAKGTRVSIDIADNGRGIARADHERIFELFRRSGAQSVPGEGIGLAHVRALVRRLGGEITVDSELGRGSRFQIVLPRVYRREADEEQA